MKKILVALALFFSLTARADIIFIDLHRSANEVKAAREAAEARGEKLIVLSYEVATDADQKNYQKLADKANAVGKKVDEEQALMNKFSSPSSPGYSTAKWTRDAYQAQLDAQAAEIKKLYDKFTFDKSDLDRALTKIESEHRTLTSLIISGHSNGDQMWGDMGEIDRESLLSVFNMHPKQKASLDSVLLWGCYAGKLEGVQWWRKNFPKMDMFGGFAGAAPLAATAASPALLKDLLIKQSTIENQKDVKGLESVFSGLKDVNVTNAALSTNGCYVANVEHVGRVRKNLVADKNEECAKMEPSIIEKGKVFAKYFKANSTEYDVAPGDPHSDTNPLRAFYNSIQTYDYCPGLLGRVQAAIGVKFDTSTILGMIFFENIRKSYEAYYGVKMGDLRRTALAKISSPGFKKDPNHNAAVKLLQELKCVPVSWITTDEWPGKPEAPDAGCLKE